MDDVRVLSALAAYVTRNLAMHSDPFFDEAPSITHDRLLLTLRRTRSRRERLFLVLHYLQGLSHEEVACVMECSVTEVRRVTGQSMALVRAELETGGLSKLHCQS